MRVSDWDAHPIVVSGGYLSSEREESSGKNILGVRRVARVNNQAWATLIGVLIGGLIGGLLNWLIVKSNFNRERKSELNIRRKSRLYTPLRRSLMRFKIQLGEEGFPEGFKIEPDDPELRIYHFQRGPNFCIWHEMKNDAREYHVPKRIRKRLDGFTSLLAQYNEAMEPFDKTVGRAWAPLGFAVLGRGDWTDGPYHDVTLGVLSGSVEEIIAFYLDSYQMIERSKWEEAAKTLLGEVGDNPLALALRGLPAKIREEMDELIDLFSEEIERIVDMYEARRSRWRLRSDGIRARRERDKGPNRKQR